MSEIDTSPLKDLVNLYLNTKSLSTYKANQLDALVEMFADLDARFVQYPLLAASVIADCIKSDRVDHQAIKQCLDVLIRMDELKGK